MLVLSRRVEEEIVFPHLGITLSVLQVRGRIVKIGIVAPQDVKVLRREVLCRDDYALPAAAVSTNREQSDWEHRRRNQLNLLQLRLDAIQSRIDRGESIDADAVLRGLLDGAATAGRPLQFSQADRMRGESRKPIRLLLVEDSDNERGLMVQLLASRGFVVHVARDGNEAFEQMHSSCWKPDFVLMDIQMPLADGTETLRRLRSDRRFSGLKIFAVTGARRIIDDEPDMGGWDGWFQKPVDLSSLVRRIHDEFAHSSSFSSSTSV